MLVLPLRECSTVCTFKTHTHTPRVVVRELREKRELFIVMYLYGVKPCCYFAYMHRDAGFQRVNMFLIGHFCSLWFLVHLF